MFERRYKMKIIRDVVHGDIYIEPEYLAIIDTKEFQRLRRIKQLSVANLVFPGAEHTRFAHCIGTFHIMKQIINHFEPIFKKCDLENIKEKEKQAALVAALLHDVGHGPYSHAFEEVLSSQGCKNISHEKMSVDIIMSEETEVHRALVENFGTEFPQLVSNIISKKSEVKQNEFEQTTNNPDLQFVLSSLISSQLDADRMDYLLRDSWYTGAKYGTIDLARTIKSMSLAINPLTKQFCVCVLERYMVDIENCLLGRYQMHKEVYFHSFKCEMEQVIKKILYRAKLLYLNNELENIDIIPDALKKMFSGQNFSIEEYCSLDDAILHSMFCSWMNCKDIELRYLCNTLINRDKYSKIRLKTKADVEKLKAELSSLIKRYGYEVDIENESFILSLSDELKMYKSGKENIFIQDGFGNLNDINQVSKVLNFAPGEEKNYIFINYELIEEKYKNANLLNAVRRLVDRHKSRNQIEREAKYTVNSSEVWEKIKDAISSMNGYMLESAGTNEQIDTYYDTKEQILRSSDMTLRIRTIDEKKYCTLKTPVEQQEVAEDYSHSVRYEYEEEVTETDINKCCELFKDKAPIFKELSEDKLEKELIVKNNREKLYITEKEDPSVLFEIVFDNVEYVNLQNNKTAKDYQVEIELKSEYLHEVRMKKLTDVLEKMILELQVNKKSKYKRGLNLTQ